MPEKTKPTFYLKNEASASFTSESYSDYTGVGLNISDKSFGSADVVIAGKASNTSFGGFAEAKYTTPKFANSNWSAESRTRFCIDESYKNREPSIYMTQRVAAKGNWNLGKGFGIYEIAGANAKISLQGEGVQSITPTSITGVSYKVGKKTNLYGEIELTKGYNLAENKWNNFGCGGYLGVKVTF